MFVARSPSGYVPHVTGQERDVVKRAEPAVGVAEQPQPDVRPGDTIKSGLPARGDVMPTSLGRCADEYHRVREIRLAMDKIVEGVKERETELQEHLINNLSKADDTGVAGLKYRAQVTTKTMPKVNDWPVFYAYVAKSGDFDMLQKRLADKAVMERLEDGVVLPGVEKMRVPSLSITKI